MKSLKLFFTGLASLSLIVQSAFADYQLDPVKLQRLNEISSVDLMEEQMKMIFTTEEDHRLITFEAIKVRKLTEKWLWRLEANGDSVALRVNGKIQAYFKPDENNLRAMFVNGNRVEFKKGMSFQSYLNQIEKATKNQAANFDQLFFQEADAVPFIVVPIALFAGLFLGSRACAQGRGQNEPPGGNDEGLPTPTEVSEIDSCPTGTCGRNRPARSCTVNGRRYTRVSPFTSQQMRTSAQNFCEYQRNANRNGRTQRNCFTDVAACTSWKTRQPNHAFGHNLSADRANQICSSIYNEIVQCTNQPAPEQPYTPPADNDPYDPGVRSNK